MIWQACNGPDHIRPIDGKLYRLVESQEQIATLGYVDTLDEQALLEQMLDQAKPVSQADCEPLHYLLKTPFRYPPLKWGSRFGRVHERSLFYGGKNIGAVLAESAFYRFVFWHSMDGTPVKDRIRSEHTDRKSTRLNSSHVKISYAVFCLKKKNERGRDECGSSAKWHRR